MLENPPLNKVLLVEDDADFAQLYQMGLSSHGYQVKWASDGELGLSLATTWLPHLVFLDMRMPKMSGLEVLSRLRAEPSTRELPVVVLSNYSDPEMHLEAEQLGALDWMVKVDATPMTLVRWIERWVAAPIAGKTAQ